MWCVAIVVGSQGVNDGIAFSDVLAFGGGGGGGVRGAGVLIYVTRRGVVLVLVWRV